MRAIADHNPIVITVYFLAVSGIAMFCMDPIILSFSFLGALLFFFTQNGMKNARSHLYYSVLFLVMALINPLVSHNGVTVLFVLNDNPVTLEAAVYGIVASLMIVTVLYWFRSFTLIMTSDKLLYLLGKLSPKLALIISMSLRYVPLFNKQAAKVNQAQTALGLYKEDNIIDRIKGGMRIFSVMITWTLENGIITADSMAARGYGTGKRTHFSFFKFRISDTVLLIIVTVLSAVTLIGIGSGDMTFVYYPAIKIPKFSFTVVTTYISYGLLSLLPTFIEAEEKVKWKYLKSKI